MGRRKEPPQTRNQKVLLIAALLEKGQSFETISRHLNVSKDLIGIVNKTMAENHMTYNDLKSISEDELSALTSSKNEEKPVRESIYEEPDYEHLAEDLMKPGVTKLLLWEEYCEHCNLTGRIPYQITQFKVNLNKFIKTKPYAALIIHKPGELMEVDWTGDQAHWTDPDTGENVYGWLFVGVLSFSGLTYAEVFPDMKEANWIKAHTNMFEYFHGVTPTLRCDNLKTGVLKHPKSDDIVLQKDYKGLAAYYNIVIVPAKPLAPKNKPLAENTVKNCEQRLLAALRNELCYSIEEYNRKLAEKLEMFNNRPFQKKNGSRRSVYEEYEKETLCPLPQRKYEYCEQAMAKVQSDGFVGFDKNFYSVPDKRPGDTVALYAYSDRVEIYDGLTLLAIHKRAVRGSWKKVYDPSHFKNTLGGEWNKDRFLRWAQAIGPNTYDVVSNIFRNGPEQVYYTSVHALLKLTDSYSKERVENACLLALRKINRPTYRQVKAILSNEQDLKENTAKRENTEKQNRKELSYLNDE